MAEAAAMRFHARGPNIPLDLIEARNEGRVIFLCGAGVSMPAGLPSFWRLVKEVAADLGLPSDDRAGIMIAEALAADDPSFAPPLDQVFGALKRDYGSAQVEQAVAARLKFKRGVASFRHKIVLRLSTDPWGVRRVITTNFDRLFELADRKLPFVVPPALPDLDFAPALEGVVYLHGRLSPTGRPEKDSLVLGSSDFGKAYLAEGWATRFIRQILNRHTLVLLGYSAEDPPVRYLLEGLHAASADRANVIYAFTEHGDAGADARWRERGVRPICYDQEDVDHIGLWRSLESWAQEAQDPAAWRQSIAQVAQAAPADLEPHQRGQVVQMLTTRVGAKTFAEVEPPPPAEWLCVFDRQLRLAKPYSPYPGEKADTRAPVDVYGTDDDRDEPCPTPDVLFPLESDRTSGAMGGLVVAQPGPTSRLPPRLRHLSHWLGKVSMQPAALWWAAGQPGLDQAATWEIERLGLKVNQPDHAATKTWRLLLESFDDNTAEHRERWWDLRDEVRRTGWTGPALRSLAHVLRPRLKASRARGAPFPPTSLEQGRTVVEFEVAFLELATSDLDIGSAGLARVVERWRQALAYGAELLSDVSPKRIYWTSPDLTPDNGAGDRHIDGASSFFLSYAGLFERLVHEDLEAARREVSLWPKDEAYFFDKLRVWAMRRAELADAASAGASLLELSDEAFWRWRGDRELLLTLQARWGDFEPATRLALEQRLLAGPAQTTQEHATSGRNEISAAVRLGWLDLQGCELAPSTLEALPRLRAADARWSREWDEHAADSMESRVYSVDTDTDPQPLLALPLSEIAETAERRLAAEEFGRRRLVPFSGLAASHPARALAALSFAARSGRYPQVLWSQFLNADEGVAGRLQRAIAGRLCRLPNDLLIGLRFEIARWIKKNAVALAVQDLDLFWRLWDRYLAALHAGGDAATRSGMGQRTVGGVPQPRAAKSLEYAVNGPIGIITQAALLILEARTKRRRSNIPKDIRIRLECALQVPGEGGDHAAAVLGRDMGWLGRIDRKFVEDRLAPAMGLEQRYAEALWNGYLSSGRVLSPRQFALIKGPFLELFVDCKDWPWARDLRDRAAEYLAYMCLAQRKGYLSYAEARRALQQGGADAGLGALKHLTVRLTRDREWASARLFLQHAWPKELKFRTLALAKRLADLPAIAGDDFEEAVETVLPYMTPFEQADTFLYGLRKDPKKQSLASRYPAACLKLVDAAIMPSPSRTPHGLSEILDLIAAASPRLRLTPSWRRLHALTV